MDNTPNDSRMPGAITRREALGTAGKAAAVVAMQPLLQTAIVSVAAAEERASAPLNGTAGVDRIAVVTGRTYLRGWAGYGDPPRPGRARGAAADSTPAQPAGSAPRVTWSKKSGPGAVTFGDVTALVTFARFSTTGAYVLELTADNGETKASSTLNVSVENPPPSKQLDAVYTRRFKISSPLWKARTKALMVSWIPHCIEYIERADLPAGGLDNFIEAGKALRGEPHGAHKGYVFSNAWVHQTVEAMSIALMIDPEGDKDIIAAHAKMRATLDAWIPIILAAQEPDGYLQTAFTLPRVNGRGEITPGPFAHWTRRADHEGYTGGYFIESAINHYLMTDKRDARLYNAARKLADCWVANIGPAPKKPWYDGHQQMEQALVRFGRFVNDMEGGNRPGQKYVDLAKFLLDCRYTAATNERERSEYDQSHLPVIEQYEAVGHAVRAAYSYSGMADVAVETHDPDYQSAVKSLWDNIVNKKYYVTGGIGSGETSEGFGGNYSLRNNAYCESCSSCGEIFFQWKLNLAYHDARHADLYETTMYNALLGSTDLDGKNYYYPNPLDASSVRGPWQTVACCVANIPRTLLMLPTWVYAKGDDAIHVNMFVGSTITVEKVGRAGVDVEMVQVTDYPWSGKVAITVNPSAAAKFSVRVRVPDRDVSRLYAATPRANGITSLAVNGTPAKPEIENGYAVITRTWTKGDRLDLVLPMIAQRVHAVDQIEADRGKVSLRYGPLVYNIEQADQDITKTLNRDAPLATEWRPGLLGGVMVITGTFTDGSPMVAIPNFARMNREATPPPPYPPPPAPVPAPGAAPVVRPLRRIVSAVWIAEG